MKKIKKIGIGILLFFSLIMFAAILSFFSVIIQEEKDEFNAAPMGTDFQFPENVEKLREIVEQVCQEQSDEKIDMTQYVNAVLALIQIESGGNYVNTSGNVMQVNYIDGKEYDGTTVEDSIRAGVKHFKADMLLFNVQSPDDIENLKLAVQGYNYGASAWHQWIMERGGKYTEELSKEYQRTQMGGAGTYNHATKWYRAYTAARQTPSNDIEIVDLEGVDEVSAKIVSFGLAQVGAHYDQGRRYLNNGFHPGQYQTVSSQYYDCSSLVWSAIHYAGIDIPSGVTVTSTETKWFQDKKCIVSQGWSSAAQPGDILCFSKNSGGSMDSNCSGIYHVAIYIGNDRMVHASNPRVGVITSNVYGKTYGVCVNGCGYIWCVARPSTIQ